MTTTAAAAATYSTLPVAQ